MGGIKGPEAANVRVLATTPDEMYAGTVKQFHDEKGWGFIACDETRQIYSKDIFLHFKELATGFSPNVGDPVQFSVQLSKDGRPEATSVTFPSGVYGPTPSSASSGKGIRRMSPY